MIKFNTLRKSLMKEGGITLGVIVVLGGLTYAASSYIDSKETEARMLESTIQSLSGQTAELERKIDLVQSSVDEYSILRGKIDAGQFALLPDLASTTLDEMRKEFRLTNLKLDISPEEVLNDAEFQKYPKVEASFREVRINFSAITDMHVFAFTESLKERLPGFIKINKVVVSRKSPITNDILVEISKGNEPDLVEAEVEFLWIGLKMKDPNATDANAAPL